MLRKEGRLRLGVPGAAQEEGAQNKHDAEAWGWGEVLGPGP